VADVVIRNLRLRLVRKGTLFWGDDPRALARRALWVLPRLLAEQLGDIDREDADVEVTAPVRLALSGSWARLAALLDGEAPELRPALARALSQPLSSARVEPRRAPRLPAPATGATPSAAPFEELLERAAHGQLTGWLARLAPGRLESLHAALLAAQPPDAFHGPLALADEALAAATLEAACAELAPLFGPTHTPLERRLAERLLGAVRIAMAVGAVPFHPAVRRLLSARLPALGEAPATAGADPHPRERSHVTGGAAGAEPERPPPARAAPLPAVEGRAPQTATAVMERESVALPYLVAAHLAREGVLGAVARRLEAGGRPDALGLWVAALVFKVGAAPARGWLYPPRSWEDAAFLSGRNLLAGEELARLADDPNIAWEDLAEELLAQLAPSAGRAALDDGLAAMAERPACPLARRRGLDRALGIAAGATLAAMGERLWPQEAGPVALALERLGSLEGRVRRDGEGLTVTLPLGRRWFDLCRARLADDVDDAPWLRGGRLCFRGG
jgi:hypothetical protein